MIGHPLSLLLYTALVANGWATTLPAGPIVVLGDPSRLQQIVWHLVTNAVKFTPRGGLVRVSAQVDGDEAVLEVRDTGPGIDPGFLPKIFERFSQADQSPTRASGGLGVGLSLVRELVELHGGRVEALNRKDEHGARFVVRLPLRSARVAEVLQ